MGKNISPSVERVLSAFSRIRYHLVRRWRTSIQVRTIGSVLGASVVVVLVLGFVLISIVAQRLLDAKYTVANEEIDRARHIVEQQIDASDASNSLQVRINAARAALADRTGSNPADGVGGATAVYEPVLIAPSSDGRDIASPSYNQIPHRLRETVRQQKVAYQFATLSKPNSRQQYKALIIGTPVSAEIQDLELYLVMPLDNEESTLALMRGLILAGGIVLIVLLVVIAWTFSQQITGPVRAASRIAERFSSGHLKERMPVEGEDEMAKLALNFNQMAESLSTQITQLEEFGTLQRQFTSDVSHELRTPLTTVRMAADVISDNKDNLDPVSRRAVELMDRELERFELLLGDLLEISRHDAGVADLSLEKVDVRGCVESAWQHLRMVADDAGAEVRFHMPTDPISVSIDSRRVERIARNLLANAIDHSEGRPIDVAVKRGPESVAVVVLDHGVGLKPGQDELVFSRFWRADPSRERRTGGTGLGLAIAREDARLHHGQLEAVGQVGVGSCFRLTLPLEPGKRVSMSPLPLEVGPGADAAVEAAAETGPRRLPVLPNSAESATKADTNAETKTDSTVDTTVDATADTTMNTVEASAPSPHTEQTGSLGGTETEITKNSSDNGLEDI